MYESQCLLGECLGQILLPTMYIVYIDTGERGDNLYIHRMIHIIVKYTYLICMYVLVCV